MPHIVKKSYLISFTALCLLAPLIFVFSEVTHLENPNFTVESITATVTTSLTSSVSSDTFCEGDAITFTATPNNGINYMFYINGILKQRPNNLSTFTHTDLFFDGDRVTVSLEKGGDTGTASLVLTLNEIENGGVVFFKDNPVDKSIINICNGYPDLLLESNTNATVKGVALAANDSRYQWMSSLDGLVWNEIIGANQESK